MLPRNIFTYWHQGFDSAPAIVRACVSQLERSNPGWNLIKLDAISARELVADMPIKRSTLEGLSLAHRSDLIRTKLLLDHGGVWLDPTVFTTKPLNEWIDDQMRAGVFFFSNPGRDRLISNWFIAAKPQNHLLSRLYSQLSTYWETNNFRNIGRRATKAEQVMFRVINRDIRLTRLWFSWPFRRLIRISPYMVYHYMVADIVNRDDAAAGVYSSMPLVSAEGPHKLQRKGLLHNFDKEARELLADPEIPLHKLTWKLAEDDIPKQCILSHIIELAEV